MCQLQPDQAFVVVVVLLFFPPFFTKRSKRAEGQDPGTEAVPLSSAELHPAPASGPHPSLSSFSSPFSLPGSV